MILFVTTQITVLRRTASDDGYEEGAWVTVASDVGADVSYNGGSTGRAAEGVTITTTYSLLANPVDLRPRDVVLDESTGIRYFVENAHTIGPEGIFPCTIAGLERERYTG